MLKKALAFVRRETTPLFLSALIIILLLIGMANTKKYNDSVEIYNQNLVYMTRLATEQDSILKSVQGQLDSLKVIHPKPKSSK